MWDRSHSSAAVDWAIRIGLFVVQFLLSQGEWSWTPMSAWSECLCAWVVWRKNAIRRCVSDCALCPRSRTACCRRNGKVQATIKSAIVENRRTEADDLSYEKSKGLIYVPITWRERHEHMSFPSSRRYNLHNAN